MFVLHWVKFFKFMGKYALLEKKGSDPHLVREIIG